jgi:pyridoxine/pyridoxamine 5'-phosphate oxidase
MTKNIEEIDAIMQQIPTEWRNRWCGGENGACACMGCVQIGNRAVMVKAGQGHEYQGDPEYINEDKISPEIYKKYKITREEWDLWKARP